MKGDTHAQHSLYTQERYYVIPRRLIRGERESTARTSSTQKVGCEFRLGLPALSDSPQFLFSQTRSTAIPGIGYEHTQTKDRMHTDSTNHGRKRDKWKGYGGGGGGGAQQKTTA